MNQAQIRKAVSELLKSPTKTTSNPHPFTNTKDLYPVLLSSFSPEAQQALLIKTHHMIHQYNEPINDNSYTFNLVELAAKLGIKSAKDNPCEWARKCSIVRCFGLTCHPNQVIDAASVLISAINRMAKFKWINASLYNLGTIELSKHDPQDPDRVCVISYLAVPTDHEATVESCFGDLMFAEGGTPMEFK